MWLKFQEIIFICFLEKNYFRKNVIFSLLHDKNSKNDLIILKFGTDVAYILFEVKIFFLNFKLGFVRNYFIYKSKSQFFFVKKRLHKRSRRK